MSSMDDKLVNLSRHKLVHLVSLNMVNLSQVLKAVEALQQYHATLRKARKSQLIEDEPMISLIIAFKKVPNRTVRPHRM